MTIKTKFKSPPAFEAIHSAARLDCQRKSKAISARNDARTFDNKPADQRARNLYNLLRTQKEKHCRGKRIRVSQPKSSLTHLNTPQRFNNNTKMEEWHSRKR